MIDDFNLREYTENNITNEMAKIINGYMYAYDEYLKDGNRNAAFMKDATDAILGISACLEVYSRDGNIHPEYAIEKLSHSVNVLNGVINYYKLVAGVEDDE